MLILVTGAPASGKTTIARKIAEDLSLPLISRDEIKERLFDVLGYSDREWSRKIGDASWSIFHSTVQQLSQFPQSFIAESNFCVGVDEAKLPSTNLIQVHCTAVKDVLLRRFEERAQSDRHPGHADMEKIDELKVQIESGDFAPLALDAPLIEVDTTDIKTVELQNVITDIQSLLVSSRAFR